MYHKYLGVYRYKFNAHLLLKFTPCGFSQKRAGVVFLLGCAIPGYCYTTGLKLSQRA